MTDYLYIIKGILFFSVLTYASIHDAKTKNIPDRTHAFLILISFIGFTLDNFFGIFLVPIPFLVVAIFGGIGGGDVKLMAGIGGVLGVMWGFIAGVIGLSLSIVINLIRGRSNESFAIGPYLATGAIAVYIIKIFT